MKTTAPFLIGLLGVAVGAILTASLLPTHDFPPRAGGHRAVPFEAVRLERTLANVAARLEGLQARAEYVGPEESIAKLSGAATRQQRTEAVTRLFQLAQQPKSDDKLRQLGAPESRQSAADLGGVLGDRFRFKTYREILEEFGRPTVVAVDQYGTRFDYGLKDVKGKWMQVSFRFTDGFVYGVWFDRRQWGA